MLSGPGHFKVYKTQYWMSCWQYSLKDVTIEWNMYFPNLGHNVCDAHAGHMKRYSHALVSSKTINFFRAVRDAEANYIHMFDINNIIPCMGKLKNTTSYEITYDEIADNDEDDAGPNGKPFIKKYFHFAYDGPGVVKCKFMKDDKEAYKFHTMKKTGACK